MSPLAIRIPVHSQRDELVGHLLYAPNFKAVNGADGVAVPREYQLVLDGLATDPNVTISYRIIRGAPTISDVLVEGANITPGVFDAIRRGLNNWTEFARRAVMHAALEADGGAVLTPGVSKDAQRAAEKEVKRRKIKVNEAFLEEVASVYRANVKHGTALAAISDHFGVALSTAGRYVFQARTAKKLPPTRKGVASK